MDQNEPYPPHPASRDLTTAVLQLAAVMQDYSDADMAQPWAWGPHDEGVRFALLGAYQELRELAVHLAAQRRVTLPMTSTQHVLAQYHAAFRDLQAVLLGVDDVLCGQVPAPAEWSIRRILRHIIGSERHFFTLVHYGLRRQRAGDPLPTRLPEGEVDRLLGPAEAQRSRAESDSLREIMAGYDELHERGLAEFAHMSEVELAGPSLWWEDIEYPLQHRLHRFDAHLRQHTVQVEKTLAALDHPPSEARRLLRLVFSALAEVEGYLIGAPDLAQQERQALAEKLAARRAEIAALVANTRLLETAVKQGDEQAVQALLSAQPELVEALDQSGLPLIQTAQYYGRSDLVNLLLEMGATPGLFEAAAIGRLDIVQQELETYPEEINTYSRDGFTALQLACYFGHSALARWLLEQGADVIAVSRNPMRLQALHAAAAHNSLAICRDLLAFGADANAQQANGFTPLQAAAQHGNLQLARLLIEAGADPQMANAEGHTAADLAAAAGHDDLAAWLSAQ